MPARLAPDPAGTRATGVRNGSATQMSAPAKARRGGRKVRSTARGAGRSGRKAARSDWAEAAGPIGFIAKGLLYVLVGLIAFGVAIGERSGTEGQRGALAGLSRGALGKAMLIALAIGLGGYAIWRFALAILGPPRKEGATDKAERVAASGRQAAENMQDAVRERPMTSVFVAFGVGVLIGHLLDRR